MSPSIPDPDPDPRPHKKPRLSLEPTPVSSQPQPQPQSQSQSHPSPASSELTRLPSEEPAPDIQSSQASERVVGLFDFAHDDFTPHDSQTRTRTGTGGSEDEGEELSATLRAGSDGDESAAGLEGGVIQDGGRGLRSISIDSTAPRLKSTGSLAPTEAPSNPPPLLSMTEPVPPIPSPSSAQQPQQAQQPQEEEEEDYEYDDPWFDAACLTTTTEDLPSLTRPIAGPSIEGGQLSSSDFITTDPSGFNPVPPIPTPDANFELDANPNPTPVPTFSTSFTLGTGKPAPALSESSKERARKLFGEEGVVLAPDLGVKEVTFEREDEEGFGSRDADADVDVDVRGNTHADETLGMSGPLMGGFKTGKGGVLKGPSEQSRERVRKLFAQDLDGFDGTIEEPPTMDLFRTATARGQADVKEDELTFETPRRDFVLETPTKLGPTFLSPLNPLKSTTPGSSFRTASGSKVPRISEAAKARALALFGEDLMGVDGFGMETGFKTPGPAPGPGAGAGAGLGGFESPSIKQRKAPLPEQKESIPGPMLDETPATPNWKTDKTAIRDVTNHHPRPTPISNKSNLSRPLLTPLAGNRKDSSPRIPGVPASPIPSTPRMGIGLGMTPRAKSTLNKRPVFRTPFKPGEGERVAGKGSMESKVGVLRTPAGPVVARSGGGRAVFDLNRKAPRESMLQAGLNPRKFTEKQLIEAGCPHEIAKIDPQNASFYHFSIGTDMKGPDDAYKRISTEGCSQIGPTWVEQHWSLILWKLASIVRAKPALWETKWTYEEVIRQLKYRYEREVNMAQRSAIKRIQEQDSPASLPMVLCVSGISRQDTNGQTNAGQPTSLLELTDGWYRIRANVDPPLQRAIDAGRLGVGYKIAISGARLDATKEGTDVLEALNRSSLRISGNSTCLVPWDRRLGFYTKPFIATMPSLNKDGGIIPLMAVKIVKMYPLAYMSREKGQKSAPWSEAEEFVQQEQWSQRYSQESDRLRDKCNKLLQSLEDDLDRLKQACEGMEVDPAALDSTEVSDAVLEKYHQAPQKAAFLRSIPPTQLIVLAQKAQEEFASESNSGRSEMEEALRTIMPPRTTRSFQVIRLEDAVPLSANKHQPKTAQLQIWDAKQLERGVLREGTTYLVSNLAPAQPASWCGIKESGEIFLSTNRNTTWKRVE